MSQFQLFINQPSSTTLSARTVIVTECPKSGEPAGMQHRKEPTPRAEKPHSVFQKIDSTNE